MTRKNENYYTTDRGITNFRSATENEEQIQMFTTTTDLELQKKENISELEEDYDKIPPEKMLYTINHMLLKLSGDVTALAYANAYVQGVMSQLDVILRDSGKTIDFQKAQKEALKLMGIEDQDEVDTMPKNMNLNRPIL